MAAVALPSDRSPAVAPPPGNPRFPLFDSLRGIAVLAVVIFHVAFITGALNVRVAGDVLGVLGDVGVVLFFVISGFLLYRPFVAARAHGRRPPDPVRYARRRALRIVPAYWVALTVLAIFPGVVGPFSRDWWR
jgi:peptidoglycan/LPS O-acetylase OafA/YrhL